MADETWMVQCGRAKMEVFERVHSVEVLGPETGQGDSLRITHGGMTTADGRVLAEPGMRLFVRGEWIRAMRVEHEAPDDVWYSRGVSRGR